MPTKRYSTEQIISKLRQAEVELSRGLRTPAMCQEARDQRADVLSVAGRSMGACGSTRPSASRSSSARTRD